MSPAIAILARAPRPGHAKTRLVPALGAKGAAQLAAWMLRLTIAKALEAGLGAVTLWWDGDLADPQLDPWRQRLHLRRQAPGDLGQRMLAAIQGEDGTLVIGTDCPALTANLLREAAQALAHADAVIAPAEDGGYVLIGLRRPEPGVFTGVDWGGPRVMAQTRERLSELGLAWEETAMQWDVDRVEDLQRLYAMCPELRGMIEGNDA